MFLALEEFLVGIYVALVVTAQDLDMKDWAAIATISWILIQVNERRRLNERNIAKFLDRGLKEKFNNLKEERARNLSRFTREPTELPIFRGIKAVYAGVKRAFSFALRILRLQRPLASMSHAMILFDSGNKDGAHKEFNKLATELLEKADLYRKYATAKEEEAMNALIYCGRVAALQKNSDATIEAFNKVLKMNEKDPDARKFIGEQFRAAGNPTEALRQFSVIIESMGNSPQAAEALRLQAEIFSENDEVGNARDALKRSLAIERERQSYAGIAQTEENLGDVFSSRERTIKAARRSYLASIENFRTAGQEKSIRRVQRKLRGLLSEETLFSRSIERLGYFILRLAKRFRAPGSKQ